MVTPITAEAHRERHEYHGRDHGIIGPLILGGIIGGIIVQTTRTQTTTVVEAPAYPYPVYRTMVYHYYDRVRGSCEVRDTYDQYNNFITRQTTCYGD